VKNAMSKARHATSRVAFVCVGAYPLFDEQTTAAIGGMETRAVLFARFLARLARWKIIFAVGNDGQEKQKKAGDIEIVRYDFFWKRVIDNVPGRFRKHKWRPVIFLDRRDLYFPFHATAYLLMHGIPRYFLHRFWRSLQADVVCCFGNNGVSAEVIADCRRSGIKTVLCIASDSDLSPDYRPGDHRLNDFGTPRWMAWYAIHAADRIMVQTARQKALLKQHFGREGSVIHNPVSIPADARQQWPQRKKRACVLWIGRADGFNKRPLLMLEVARACPDIAFTMIVNKGSPSVFETLLRTLPANVTLIERVPHHAIWDYYRNARLLVNTSTYEGFPNTFLQAAVSGAVVVSLQVDPENILTEKGCGVCAGGDFEALVRAVRGLWDDETLAERYAETFLRYVRDNHALENQGRKFEALLDEVLSSPPRSPAPGPWKQPFTRFATSPGEGAPNGQSRLG
jgi:glycosyltransferase involved in cell wall biosynthesis